MKYLALSVEDGIFWETPLTVDGVDIIDTNLEDKEILLLVQGKEWQELFPDEPPKDWQNRKMEVREY